MGLLLDYVENLCQLKSQASKQGRKDTESHRAEGLGSECCTGPTLLCRSVCA